MREIVLDTETTGLDIKEGHRIIEIGACEMIDHIITNKTFHMYINPEREINIEAMQIHGISNDDLKDKPTFFEICDEFIEFIGNSTLIIHNSNFDISFINNELKLCGKNFEISNKIIDTMKLAKKKLPGSLVNLEALCRRYNVNLNNRKFHGALVDAVLLSEVYIELIGGKQTALAFENKKNNNLSNQILKENQESIEKREIRHFIVNDNTLTKHREFIASLENPIWNKYI